MSEHARCAPSSADRIELCHGSVQMQERYPQEETEESREGDAVHWAGATLLSEMRGALTDESFHGVGTVAPNGVVLNNEMLTTANLWVTRVTDRGRIGHVEETIREWALHPDNWGTPDHWDFDDPALTLYVDDLKNGHRYVEVKRNRQLANYAAQILNKLGLFFRDDIKVRFRIVQPNAFHRDGDTHEWWTTSGELRAIWHSLSAAFAAAVGPAPLCTPSLSACRDCKARWDCEAALEVVGIAKGIARQSIPLQMSAAHMARELRLLEEAEGFIKSMREGMQDRVMFVIRRQQAMPHFAIDRSPGRRVWNDDAVGNGIIDICKAYGVQAGRTEVGITPLQAIAAGVPDEVVKQFSRVNSGKLVLVEDDGSKAAAIFNNKE